MLIVPRVSLFVGNSLYLLALGYYTVITFLGYNGQFEALQLFRTQLEPLLTFLQPCHSSIIQNCC